MEVIKEIAHFYLIVVAISIALSITLSLAVVAMRSVISAHHPFHDVLSRALDKIPTLVGRVVNGSLSLIFWILIVAAIVVTIAYA